MHHQRGRVCGGTMCSWRPWRTPHAQSGCRTTAAAEAKKERSVVQKEWGLTFGQLETLVGIHRCRGSKEAAIPTIGVDRLPPQSAAATCRCKVYWSRDTNSKPRTWHTGIERFMTCCTLVEWIRMILWFGLRRATSRQPL